METNFQTPGMSNCQTPGMFVPYSPGPFGMYTGSPSPPPSLCSEPIFQMPTIDNICKSPRVQMKNPKIQLLNKTLGDARKKKNNPPRGQTITSRAELPSMVNFFQCRDSMSSLSELSCDGGVRAVPMSPLFNCSNTPIKFPQAKISSAQFPQAVNLLHCSQQSIFQFPMQPISQNMTQPLVKFESQNQFVQQQPMQNNTFSGPSKWEQPLKEEETVKHISKVRRSEARSSSRSKPSRKTKASEKKKGLISTAKDTIKKSRKKHRKKIQQKNKSLHKTELCTNWMLTSTCSFGGKCYFAHGIEELKKRVRVGNFKTQPCVDSPREESQCMFGSRCYYCHPGEAMRRTICSSYYDVDYYKALRNDFPKIEYPFGIFL